ncbi:hypothetical protein ACFYKX_13210 [Cytobacillus sp. FJAT-54145]|uniref:Uncharacterized protein n=1 Tax=Cytobacillus spartinae TaxID=3299023 RepID=A0ABW6KDA8_9BACI
MGLACPCKFLLGVPNTEATVTVTSPEGTVQTFTDTINFSAEQCFTAAAMCNPAVDNFTVNFGTQGQGGNTINFTQGRRGFISCEGNTVAILEDGTAQGSGNLIPNQDYTVDFSYTINNGTATVEITAVGEDGTVFQTTFEADVTPQTFIGDCEDTVNPND